MINNHPRRILIVNPFGIGDVLFSTPLIQTLRQAFPDVHLAYLCNRRTEGILRHNAHVNELFIYERDELITTWRQRKTSGLKALGSLLWEMRRRRFEVVIDLSLGERYSFVFMLLGVGRRIGFDFRHRGRFLTHGFTLDGYQDHHVVEYYGQLLEMIGLRMRGRRLELTSDEGDRREADELLAQLVSKEYDRVIGLVPGGGVSWGLHAHFRRWSTEKFIEVGRALSERYAAKILIFGEREDREACGNIARAIGAAAQDLSGRTTLGQFISFIGRCDLIISSDGGPIHIAASQDVPTVSIFGPVDPLVYGPYPRTAKHQIVCRSDLPCRPCYHQFRLPPCPYERACLTQLDVADVLQACEVSLSNAETSHAEGSVKRS